MTRQDFDSDEEMYFYWWLEELEELGFVNKIIAQPKAFQLSKPLNSVYDMELKTKTNRVLEEIMKGHIYTTDFYVEWNPEKMDIVATRLLSDLRKKKGQSLQILIAQHKELNTYYSYIEVKPDYDMQNMTRLAKINQKWVFEKHGIYVNIVKPMQHFNKSFTPERFLTTNKSGKPRTIKYKNIINAQEFLGLPQLSSDHKVLF